MKKLILFLMVSGGAALLGTSPCWATRGYVTDSFEEFTLRAGPGNEYRIIALLSSGQAVDIVEPQKDWTRIKIPGGEREGWVVSRFLITRLPWSLQSESLREENAALKTKLAQIEGTYGEVQRRRAELAAELQKTTKLLEETTGSYATLKQGAEGFLRLQRIHESTEAALNAAREEIKNLRTEQEQLLSSQINRWFATGALVLLCGLLLGVMVGRQQKTRKSFYS